MDEQETAARSRRESARPARGGTASAGDVLASVGSATGGPGHFWLPVATRDRTGGVRHAFRGTRWEGQSSLPAVCGDIGALARPSEMDWIRFPTCPGCNDALKSEHRESGR
ncbi:hypothetical protein GCM10027563_09730 [Parasphingorhabdus pacifica]